MHITRMRVVSALLSLAIIACAPASEAQSANTLSIQEPWAATTNPGATVAGGYVVLRNTSNQADRLVSASSARARRVELHEMSMSGGMMRMRPVAGIDVPAHGSAALQPGGLHIMFIDIDAQFQDGQRVPVTLTFERAGDVEATFTVRPRTIGGGHDH